MACDIEQEALEKELAGSRAAEETARSESLVAIDVERRNARRAAVESGQKMDDYKERLAKVTCWPHLLPSTKQCLISSLHS